MWCVCSVLFYWPIFCFLETLHILSSSVYRTTQALLDSFCLLPFSSLFSLSHNTGLAGFLLSSPLFLPLQSIAQHRPCWIPSVFSLFSLSHNTGLAGFLLSSPSSVYRTTQALLDSFCLLPLQSIAQHRPCWIPSVFSPFPPSSHRFWLARSFFV